MEWSAKFGHGIYPGSQRLITGPPGESVFFSLYYLTTGLHGLHVLIGGTLLGFVAVRVQQGKIDRQQLLLAGERRPLLAPGGSDLDFHFPAVLSDSVGAAKL